MDELNLQEREYHFNLTVRAPAERTFNAWVDPAKLAKWWGPELFTNVKCELSAFEGGEIMFETRQVDGKTLLTTGTILEVLSPSKLVFETSTYNEEGETLIQNLYGIGFVDQGKATKIEISVQVVKVFKLGKSLLESMPLDWASSLKTFEQVVTDIDLNLLN